MTSNKPPDPRTDRSPAAASEWLEQLVKHLQLYFSEESEALSPLAGPKELGRVATNAMVDALRDAGLAKSEVRELLAGAAFRGLPADEASGWEVAHHTRRLELIDKDIQGFTSPAERLELIELTERMRQHFDTEENLPLEGARRLHQQLLDGQPDIDRDL